MVRGLPANKVEKLKYRILAVEALRAVRRLLPYSYRQLSREINFDETLLARYSTGITVPSYEQAEELIAALRKSLDPARITLMKAGEYKGLLDLVPILSDPFMLKLLSLEFYERFRGRDITKILVPETSGITLATALALTFDSSLVIARRTKDNPMIEYVEEHIIEPPAIKNIFYIPKGSLKKEDKVLVVDDIVQTGFTLAVMKKLVERAGAKLQGVATIVVVGDEWRRRVDIDKVEALITISKV